MGYVKRETERQNVTPKAERKMERGQSGETKQRHLTRAEEILDKVEQLAAVRHYEKGVDLLNSSGRDPRLLNAKGVCLLRLGRYEDAIRLYHDLVLNPGCMWSRPDLPTVYKTNYATALMLGGHPSGCLEILAEINEPQHPFVQRLQAAIKNWESQLTLWQKLNWRFGRIDPANRPVTIDFEAGDFESRSTREDAPHPVVPPNSRNAA